MRALILPSPFLPGLVHAPLAAALGRRGWGVVVADPKAAPASAEDLLITFAAAAAEVRPDVVLTHSNAGRYAAHVAGDAVTVHLDGALPPVGGGAVAMVPESLIERLAATADDSGLLPPWTRWWPDEDVAALLPDPRTLAAIRAQEPRLPMSYVRSRLGAPAGWVAASQAYLAFGGGYADEVALARAHGWPVAVLDAAGHLHHLVDPEGVADTVLALAEGVRGGQAPHGTLSP
ncbi:hypothetical protein [uncultured Phycicoccus sp.]|uniref:hypothetical protein n=1 Tax=uncultured Phycicoccus sp. TaxID=661422 RepID=UPI0026365FF0|nr:hypothetical protein [uncultured Phycicoccus sp.]